MLRTVLGCFLLATALSAFGSHAGGEPVVSPPGSVVQVGETTVLSVTIWPGGLSSGFPYSMQFSSDNPLVADIHGFASGSGYARPDPIPNNGKIFVAGIAPGVAHVTASGFSQTIATVTVEAKELPVIVSPAAVTILSGHAATLTALVPNANGSVVFLWYLGHLNDQSHLLQVSSDPVLRFTPGTIPTTYVWVRGLSARGDTSAEATISIDQPRVRVVRH